MVPATGRSTNKNPNAECSFQSSCPPNHSKLDTRASGPPTICVNVRLNFFSTITRNLTSTANATFATNTLTNGLVVTGTVSSPFLELHTLIS